RLHFPGPVPYGSAFWSIAVLSSRIARLRGPEDPAYVLVGTLPDAPPLPPLNAIAYHTLPPAFTESPVSRIGWVIHDNCRWTEVRNDGVVRRQFGLLNFRRAMHVVAARFIRTVEGWGNQACTERAEISELPGCFHHNLPLK